MTLNEIVQGLDLLVCACVDEGPREVPPAQPAAGACFIVGAAPTEARTGKANQIAAFTSGGWRYFQPAEGQTAFVRSVASFAVFSRGVWQVGDLAGSRVLIGGEQVLGARLGSIADPGAGEVVDSECRAAVNGILAAMREHGLIAS